MSAKVLTKAAAKEARIDVIEDGRGSRPSMMWSLRCAQCVVPVRLTQRPKRKWTFLVQSPGGRRELAALAPVTNHRPYGEVAASCLAQSRAIIPKRFQNHYGAWRFGKP